MNKLRILVLGGFSGQSDQALDARGLKARSLSPIAVSRDNIAELPGKLGAHCSAGGGKQEDAELLRFFHLTDFHPDSLLKKVPALAKLRELRDRLMQPGTFEKAAAELRSLGVAGVKPEAIPALPRVEPAPVAEVELPSTASLLDQAISQTKQPGEATRRGAELPEGLDEVVRRSAAALRVPQAATGSAALIEAAETAIALRLRAILHDPAFQAMEAAWRGLDFLVKRLPTGPQLKVYMADLGFASLKADLGSADALEATALFDLLVNQTVGTPGGEPWGLIVADYTVAASKVDLLVAGCMARVAAKAEAPLVAAASPALFGCESVAAFPDPRDWQEPPAEIAQAWTALRNQAEAAHLGLVAPRFLLRMPYGPESSPLEAVAFNELPDPAEHEGYLWGNGAWAIAAVLGEAFERGGRLRLEIGATIGDLPLYGTEHDGEYFVQPCAEALLSYRAGEQVLAAGVMPLLSVRGSGSVHLAAWQSVAASGAPPEGMLT